ncbi:MAG: hypothetical protein KA713_08100 [Chryseotalea sp. WA131a]|nr:MAG: hypothetical protein KA713_08100 [Chryseotalea sp. WA131a]
MDQVVQRAENAYLKILLRKYLVGNIHYFERISVCQNGVSKLLASMNIPFDFSS